MAGGFKLQSVLDYRQLLENQAQQTLSGSLQQRAELLRHISRQQELLDHTDQDFCRRRQEGMRVADIELYEVRIHHCRKQLAELNRSLSQLDRRIAAERETLLHAAQKRQVMEKLKHRQEAEYKRELSRRERILLDEISLRRKGGDP